MNIFSFFCNVVVGLLLTPYLVSHVGIAAYGLIPLAMIFTEYIGVITQSLTASINRSLTMTIRSDDVKESNKVFNTALFIMLLIVVIQIITMLYPIVNINSIINIPHSLSEVAVVFFLMIFFNFSLSLISSIFSVSMYSSNRLDLMEISNVLRSSVRAIAIIVLFNWGEVSLISVGIASLLSGLTVFVFSVVWWFRLTPSLKISPKFIDRSKLKPIFGIGGWLLINQVGFLLFLKVDILIINKMIGPVAGGEYSVVVKLSEVLRIMSGLISGVLGPVAMIYYAQNEMKKMINITQAFIKVLSLSMVIPVVIVCVFSKEILRYWMGREYEHLHTLVWIVILPLVINLGVTPLFSINVAMNKIKYPALVTLSLGAVGALLSMLLIKHTALGYLSVAIASGVILTIKNVIFTPIYSAKIMGLPTMTFVKITFLTLIYLTAVLILAMLTHELVSINGLMDLFEAILIASVLSFIFMRVFYSSSEIKALLYLRKRD